MHKNGVKCLILFLSATMMSSLLSGSRVYAEPTVEEAPVEEVDQGPVEHEEVPSEPVVPEEEIQEDESEVESETEESSDPTVEESEEPKTKEDDSSKEKPKEKKESEHKVRFQMGNGVHLVVNDIDVKNSTSVDTNVSNRVIFHVDGVSGYSIQSVKWNNKDVSKYTQSADEDDYIIEGVEGDIVVVVETKDDYPAQSFSDSTNGIHVEVDANRNIFPEGTKMELSRISNTDAKSTAQQVTDQEISDAVGVDITFKKDGKEVQPKNGQEVSVKITLDTPMEGNNFSVIHKDDDGTATKISGATSKGADFNTNSFSIYVIGSENPVSTYTFTLDGKVVPVNVKCNDGDACQPTVEKQKVKNGEMVYLPETPSKEGMKFIGWRNTTTGEIVKNPFKANVSSSQSYEYEAAFEEIVHVFYMDKYDRISRIKQLATGKDKVVVSDVQIPLSSTESITGWYKTRTQTGTDSDGNPIYTYSDQVKDEDGLTLDDDLVLYPKVEQGAYLYFDTGQGASYIKPEFVSKNDKTKAPSNPTKAGYTFNRWVDNQGRTYSFGETITENKTIHAVWTPNTNVSYKVIHWQENPNDNGYSFAESETKQGTAGQNTNATAKSYSGFQVQRITQQTIEGDGTTIVNVYYRRNTYSVRFYRTRTAEITHLRITAKYGADIKDLWPSKVDSRYNSNWRTSYGGDTYQSGIEKMPLYGANFYEVTGTGNATMNLNYELEQLDGSYKLDHTDLFKTNTPTTWATTAEDHYDIEGFTYTNNVRDRSPFSRVNANTYQVTFRYSRNSYDIIYINGDDQEKTSHKYEADISNTGKTPRRPSSVPEGSLFGGWYTNSEYAGDPYDFSGKKMPAENITLYAKWILPEEHAKYYLNIAGTGSYKPAIIMYGDTINENDMPTVYDADGKIVKLGDSNYRVDLPENVEWIGWATRNSHGEYITYNFDDKVYSDIDLFPYYMSKDSYVITYDVGEGSLKDGSGKTFTDPKHYAANGNADVQDADNVKAPKGKVFLYWSDGTNHYYPEDTFVVTGNMTLKAEYGDENEVTSLTYHSNYPTDVRLSEKLDTEKCIINNDNTTQLKDPASNGFAYTNNLGDKVAGSIDSDWYFVGWNTEADGSGHMFNPGDTPGIDNTSSNDIYAIWKKYHTVTVEKKVEGNMGDVNQVFDFAYTSTAPTITNGTFQLKSEGKEVIRVKEGATFTVDETTGATDGYITTIQVDGVEATGTTLTNIQANHTITFTNTKNMNPPTGIHLDASAPWIVLILMAAVWFGFKKGKRILKVGDESING